MESYEEDMQSKNVNLEKINEELLDALSLIILLENDMETQKADSIHVRLIKMVHHAIKNIQKSLSGNRQEENNRK